MKFLTILLVGNLLAACGDGASDSVDAESAAIVGVWSAYRESLIARDGAKALALVTPATVAEYDRHVKMAATFSRADLRAADTLDRFVVLLTRARLDGDRIRSMSGADLFTLGVDRGWVGSDLPEGVRVLRVRDDVADLALIKNGVELDGDIPLMRKAGSAWRVDLVEMTRMSKPAFQAMFAKVGEQAGTDVNGAMFPVIGQLTGTPASDALWDPPR